MPVAAVNVLLRWAKIDRTPCQASINQHMKLCQNNIHFCICYPRNMAPHQSGRQQILAILNAAHAGRASEDRCWWSYIEDSVLERRVPSMVTGLRGRVTSGEDNDVSCFIASVHPCLKLFVDCSRFVRIPIHSPVASVPFSRNAKRFVASRPHIQAHGLKSAAPMT